jgi:Na+-translocating ferredoxin:NAD+ oxidoreductase RNF subunit RnfB
MDATLLIPILGLGSLGLLFGMFLAYASKKFSVEIDPKVELILENLPGANCGGCGYPGCSGYAEAVASGKADISLCAPGGAATVAKIAEILGVENNASAIPVIAAIQCRGGHAEAKTKFLYQGVHDCTAAQMIDGGDKACNYGCLGLGTCVSACPFDAIEMGPNGLPIVDEKKCTGCGNCVKACPRQIITLIPINQKIYLGCVSHDKGKSVKDICTVGCTGCSLCSRPKITPSGAILMDNNLPIIKDIYAEDLAVAAEKCPSNSFVVRAVAE